MITHTIATIEDFFNHGRFFDGHETNQDMWHTKVSESPSETAEDVLPARIENTPPNAHCVTVPVAASVYSYTVVKNQDLR